MAEPRSEVDEAEVEPKGEAEAEVVDEDEAEVEPKGETEAEVVNEDEAEVEPKGETEAEVVNEDEAEVEPKGETEVEDETEHKQANLWQILSAMGLLVLLATLLAILVTAMILR
jgi:hypothetical protein